MDNSDGFRRFFYRKPGNPWYLQVSPYSNIRLWIDRVDNNRHQCLSTTHNPGSISNTTACAEAHSQLQASPLLQPETCIIRTNIQLGESPGSSVHRMGCTSGTGATITETIATPGVYRYRPYCNLRMRNTCNHHCRCNGLFDHSQRGAISGSPICAGGTVNILSNTAASTGTPASSGPTYSWHRSVSPFSSWTRLRALQPLSARR